MGILPRYNEIQRSQFPLNPCCWHRAETLRCHIIAVIYGNCSYQFIKAHLSEEEVPAVPSSLQVTSAQEFKINKQIKCIHCRSYRWHFRYPRGIQCILHSNHSVAILTPLRMKKEITEEPSCRLECRTLLRRSDLLQILIKLQQLMWPSVLYSTLQDNSAIFINIISTTDSWLGSAGCVRGPIKPSVVPSVISVCAGRLCMGCSGWGAGCFH